MDEIWTSTCRHMKVDDDVAIRWLEKFKMRMSSESGRLFHNWNELLERKAKYLGGVNKFVVLAVYFQYFEFDVRRNCVEENCQVFREFCDEAAINDETTVKTVLRLLGNETIKPYDELDQDLELLQDLDLVVLGLPEEDYENYTQLLRKEYFHLDDANYKKMRLKILQTFLIIPTIYSTQSFQDIFEDKARCNIKAEIEDLKQ